MAALVEGHNYELASQESTSADKTIVHVKLTDTALRAFEEYEKIQRVTGRKPSIQVRGSEGVIRVPIEKSSDNPEGFRNFEFSLQNLLGDPKGSFEAVQQDVEQYMDRVECLGVLGHKLTIRATDDIYKTTRQRMLLAEEESQKSCAKEIKPSGRYIGRKIKKVVKRGDIDLPRKSSPSYQANNTTQYPNKTSLNKSSNPHSPSGANVGRTAHNSSPHQQGKTSHSSSPHHQGTNSIPRAGPLGRSSPNPNIINRPYRDRIIHLLAIRPYKKPELLIRLQKDGMRDKDKNSLGTILQQVGVLNPRDNSFTLMKTLYTDIKEDWPGYTDTDRALLKRRMQQLETNASTTSSPAPSPAHSNSSQGSSPSSSHKRPTSTTDDDLQPSKKARIAHEARTSHDRKDTQHKSSSHSNQNSRHKKSPSPGSPKVTSTTTPDSTVDSSKVTESKVNKSQVLSQRMEVDEKIVVEKVKERREEERKVKEEKKHIKKDKDRFGQINNENIPQQTAKSPASSTSEIPEYVLKYTRIQSGEQRQRYKQDFNSEYEGYRDLHSKVIKVTRRFKELEAVLRQKEEGSEDYENIKNEIVTEYKAVKDDKTYIENRKKCDYLHKKLAHIKKLILEYDNQASAPYS